MYLNQLLSQGCLQVLSPVAISLNDFTLVEFSSKLKAVKDVLLGLDLVCIYYCM